MQHAQSHARAYSILTHSIALFMAKPNHLNDLAADAFKMQSCKGAAESAKKKKKGFYAMITCRQCA